MMNDVDYSMIKSQSQYPSALNLFDHHQDLK